MTMIAPQNFGAGQALLEAKGLEAGYSGLQILRGVAVTCHSGRVTTVIGPNGSGKSTLMRCIAGLLPLWAGEIRMEEKPIQHLPAFQRVGGCLAFVPQHHSLFRDMTVEENLLVGASVSPRRSDSAARVAELCAIFPALKEWLSKKAGVLSGGQQRVAEVCRALMSEPKLLILDEPTAGLSPLMSSQLLSQVKQITADAGVGVLMVEQNIKEGLAISDDVYALVDGKNDSSGPAREFQENLTDIVSGWLVGRKSQ